MGQVHVLFTQTKPKFLTQDLPAQLS
jgi:hypothetical protein